MRHLLASMAALVLVAGMAPGSARADGNQPPVAVDDPPQGPSCVAYDYWGGSYPIPEDPPTMEPSYPGVVWFIAGCLPTGNDYDPDGDPFTLEIVDQPSHGSAAWLPGQFNFLTYDPDPDWSTPRGDMPGGTWVSDSLTYRLFDGQDYSNLATYRFWLAPINDAPSFTPGAPFVEGTSYGEPVRVPWATAISPGPANEGAQTVTFDVVTDTRGAPLMFGIPPAIDDQGVLTFAPGKEPGLAEITVTAHDDGGLDTWGLSPGSLSPPDDTSDPVTFWIVVQPPLPAPPDAVDDEATVIEDLPNHIGVMQNDSDRNHDPLLIADFTDPAHGTVEWGGINGALLYSPDKDFNGTDTFDYTVTDGPGSESTATVTVTVTPVNDDPVANPDDAVIGENAGPTFIDVLANDTDVDGDTLAIAGVVNGDTGVAAIVPGGVTYLPPQGFLGAASFSYRVDDGQGGTSGLATVSVTVVADTAPPVVTAPTQVVAGSSVGASSVKVRLGWAGTDAGTGIASYQLQERRDGGAWRTVTLASRTSRAAVRRLDLDHAYSFRLRATDANGNTSGWLAWTPITPRLRQETTTTAAWTGTWRRVVDARFSRSASRWTASSGRRVTFPVTGRAIAWVGRVSGGGGSAVVLVDGVSVGTVSCRGPLAYRAIIFRTTLTPGSHRVQIRPRGDGRVDVDALVVLR